jgi:hypothetical protein
MVPDSLQKRLAGLQLNHLPHQILSWIERDLEGMDEPSMLAILTPEYAIEATRCAIREMARVGVPVGLGARPPKRDKSEKKSPSEGGASGCIQ